MSGAKRLHVSRRTSHGAGARTAFQSRPEGRPLRQDCASGGDGRCPERNVCTFREGHRTRRRENRVSKSRPEGRPLRQDCASGGDGRCPERNVCTFREGHRTAPARGLRSKSRFEGRPLREDSASDGDGRYPERNVCTFREEHRTAPAREPRFQSRPEGRPRGDLLRAMATGDVRSERLETLVMEQGRRASRVA